MANNKNNAQPVDVLAVMDDAALTLAKVAQIQMTERADEMREARAAVAELVRLTERVLYVQSLTGNAKAQAWDKLDRDLRATLARVQGGAA